MTDIPGDSSTTTARITGTGQYHGVLEVNGDIDWWRFDVIAGYRYQFKMSGDGGPNSLDNGKLSILNATGNAMSGLETTSFTGSVSFTATENATYFVRMADWASSNGRGEGNYIIHASMDDDVKEGTITSAEIRGTGITSGVLGQNGDTDWWAPLKIAAMRRSGYDAGGVRR